MSDTSLSFPDAPRVELDRRIADLVVAAKDVLDAQGRLRALLRANQVITQQLDLDSVLAAVIEAAQQLTGAEQGTLSVVDDQGGLDSYVHGETGPVEAVRDPHPSSETVDAVHAGSATLDVPVPVRGAIFGTLTLTGSPRGAFSLEDEELVRSLVTTAGFAIDNARLYRETRQRQEWVAASAEITAQLLGPNVQDALSVIASKVQQVADAMSTYVILVTDDPDQVSVVDVQGDDPTSVRGSSVPLPGTIAERVLRSKRAERFEERTVQSLGMPALAGFGPMMAVPLGTSDRPLGAFVVARPHGAAGFTASDLAAAEDFAGRAAVALELVAARRSAEQVLLFEDRGRIARDLHDRVIQDLFAIGMQLQGVLGTMPPGRDADRVDASITGLDAAIAQIRRIIFTLQSARPSSGRQQVFELIEHLAESYSVEPSVTISGPVDATLDVPLMNDVLAVVNESITNAVKHADAKDIAVVVAADAQEVSVTVSNDGTPPTGTARRSGLGNIDDRASRRHGRMSLDGVNGRTVLTWKVPVPTSEDGRPR